MKAGTADMPETLLPPDDGAVARALADLEAKLSAWTSAVADVQNKLCRKAAQLAEANPSPNETIETAQAAAPAAPEQTRSDAAQQCETTAAPIEEASVAPKGTPEPAEEATTPDAEKVKILREAMGADLGADVSAGVAGDEAASGGCRAPTEEEEALLAVLDPESAELIRAEFHAGGGRESIEELIAAHNDALLAPLEPEVQKAIRVKYRMLLGRKSIKELIEQHQSTPKQQPKSWWERVRG